MIRGDHEVNSLPRILPVRFSVNLCKMGASRGSIIVVPLLIVFTLFLIGEWYLYHYNHYPHGNGDIDHLLPAMGEINLKDATHVQGTCSPVTKLKMDLVTVPHFLYDAADEALLKREKEYMTALQRNLNHDHVRRIHVLTDSGEKLTQRLKKAELSNQSKLLTFELKRIETTRDVFEYVSQHLVGIDTMFLNGDNYLGSGFDCVDPDVMRKNKIMYAITRQVKKEETCGEKDYCTGMHYQGSHDAFLFHLTEPFAEDALKHLEFTFPYYGMENIVIWIFKTKLKYCVLNPCTILEVFHLHCSSLRNYRGRVNNANNTGLSPFTKELVCNSSDQVSSTSPNK